MEVEAPPRAQWIRTILFEISRVANVSLFLGDLGLQLGALTAGVLRLPRPRVRAQPDRGGHRRALPPELRPHRRPEGRPPEGLDRRDQAGHGATARLLRRDGGPARRQRDLPEPAPAASASIPAEVAPSYGLSGAEPPRAAASTGTSVATTAAGPRLRQARLEGLDPSRRRLASPATGCGCRRPARPPRSSTSCSTACRADRSWPRSRASSRCPRARRTSPPRTRSARWATTS